MSADTTKEKTKADTLFRVLVLSAREQTNLDVRENSQEFINGIENLYKIDSNYINKADEEGNTLLHLVAKNYTKDTIPPNPDYTDEQQYFPENLLDIIKVLKDKGASLDLKNNEGLTAYDIAKEKKAHKEFRRVIKPSPEQVCDIRKRYIAERSRSTIKNLFLNVFGHKGNWNRDRQINEIQKFYKNYSDNKTDQNKQSLTKVIGRVKNEIQKESKMLGDSSLAKVIEEIEQEINNKSSNKPV